MIENPPTEYSFILPKRKNKFSVLNLVLNSKILKFFYKKILKNLFPKNQIYKKINKPKIPSNIDLVFSSQTLDIDFPYVIEILDHPASLAGYNYELFTKNKKIIEKQLFSNCCKKIIIVNESSLNLMKKYFNKEIIKKCTLVRAAIKEQFFEKKYYKKQIQILFMGSLANPDDFYIKGGLEAVESFSRITKKFPHTTLIIRCKVPNEIKKKYKLIKNIKFLESKLDKNSWAKLLRNTDISLQPGHIYPLMATIEPMSYGIPIIMLDTYGVRDYLTQKNAILIKPSKKITEYNSPQYPLNVRSKRFINQIKKLDNVVVEDLATTLEKLILDKNLREKMGNEGRKISETKFSIEKKNKLLKQIFDEIINQFSLQ